MMIDPRRAFESRLVFVTPGFVRIRLMRLLKRSLLVILRYPYTGRVYFVKPVSRDVRTFGCRTNERTFKAANLDVNVVAATVRAIFFSKAKSQLAEFRRSSKSRDTVSSFVCEERGKQRGREIRRWLRQRFHKRAQRVR